MTLDIEHFQKVTLLREMEDRGEDGYAIVADYIDVYKRQVMPLMVTMPWSSHLQYAQADLYIADRKSVV